MTTATSMYHERFDDGDVWGLLKQGLSEVASMDEAVVSPLVQFKRRVEYILSRCDQLPILNEVRKLVAWEGVYLVGQKIYHGEGGAEKVEILARVANNGNNISPDVFIPTVCATVYKNAFDHTILQEAFRIIAERGTEHVSYSINVNPSTLEEDAGVIFLQKLWGLGRKYPEVDSKRIIFEVLETERISNHEKFDRVLRNLRELGYRIAIDDFHPVGNHNLMSIRQMREIDIVKFDGEYISRVFSGYQDSWNHDTGVAEFQRNVREISQTHPGVQFVIEKIEDEKMFDFFLGLFHEHGIRDVYFQGYFFHRPTKL